MREIKFRIWDVKNKKMIRFEDEESDELLMCPFTGALYDHLALLYRKEFKRMQFTGLHDKNGLTDIYEGDIIDIDGTVIGNIYESPQIHKKRNNHVVKKMGTEAWRGSESITMGRGCKYSK